MRTETDPAIHVRVTYDAADWRAVAAEQRASGVMPRLAHACLIVFAVLAVCAVGTTAYALFAPVFFPTLPHRLVPWQLVFSIVSWAAIVLPQRLMRQHLLPPMRPGAALDVRFDDAGITFGEDRSRFVAWRWIVRARNIDDAIVLADVQSNVFVLPKRLFADGGAALWTLLETRLMSRYGLIRRADARRVIFNTKTA